MTHPLAYTRQAQADLESIFDFIAADNPRLALRYVEDIQAACEDLCAMPLIGVDDPTCFLVCVYSRCGDGS